MNQETTPTAEAPAASPSTPPEAQKMPLQAPRKKVLFLITKATWGGAQRYVWDLATHLPTDEFKVVVAYGKGGQLSEILQAQHIDTVTLPRMDRDLAIIDDFSSFHLALTVISELKPDIVHVNSSKAAALGALAARLSGVKRIVFTVHGWPFKENRNAFSKAIIYLISWFTALCSHVVIVVSKEDEVLGAKMPLMKGKIVRVPLGIEPPSFATREEAMHFFRARASSDNLPDSCIRIGTIAELTPNKGVAHGIEALADLRRESDKNYVYIVIGDGEQRAELEHAAKRFAVSDKVIFLGFVPNAAHYVKGFDVFLMPSEKEGMPYAILEAGEAGVPVVTTIKKDEELALMYPNLKFTIARNAYSISDAIRGINFETFRGIMNAIPHAPRFPLSQMVQKTVALYNSSK